MAETRFLINAREFKYEGLIPVQGLYKCARDFLEDNDYDPFETRNEEQNFEDGKQIFIMLTGEKKLSDFAKVEFEVSLIFKGLQEMFVEKEGKKLKLHKGNVTIKTDVLLYTDYGQSFEQNAFQYFLRVVMDKFVFKNYVNRAIEVAKKNYSRFEETMKSYLNMEAFK